MKSYEIILNIEREEEFEQDTFTFWDGLSVVVGAIFLFVTLLFLYYLMCYGG